MFTSLAYAIYILASIGITVFVSRTLSKNGEIYLIDGFNGNEVLAKSINHMLVVGFYLLNLGFVLLRMRTGSAINTIEEVIVYLSYGLGFVLFALGIAHFFNMLVIHKYREGQIKKREAAQAMVEILAQKPTD